MHVRGQAFRVKGRDGLVVDQHILPPRLVFQFRDVGDQLPVVREKQPLRASAPGTSASRMNTSRAVFGSIAPKDTVRLATSVRP